MATDLKKTILVAAGLLGGFSIVGTGLVALTHLATDERILENEREALLARLHELVPDNQFDNDMLEDVVLVKSEQYLGTKDEVPVYRARMKGEPVAAVFPVIAPEGYGGAIRLLIAIHADGVIAGVRVVSHKETPGLGDAIEHDRSNWIEEFDGHSLADLSASQWAVKKDGGVFDQFTGATITPRAVVSAVYQAMLFFEHNQTQLFNEPPHTVSVKEKQP